MPLYGDAKREYDRKWMAARRAAYMDGRSCAYCGSTEKLEIDHVNPATKVTHRVWSWSRKRRDEELAKCQILCSSCHLKKTVSENTLSWRPHGERRTYLSGCRCEPCRKAKVDYERLRRRRKKAQAAQQESNDVATD